MTDVEHPAPGGRMVLKLCVAAASLMLAANCARAALDLSRDGKSAYVIVVGDDAIPAEKTAAKELQDHLKQVTGAELPIASESAVAGGDAPQILIGQTKLTRQVLPNQDWAALEHDGIVMKTVGNRLILAGGRPRGALYAVDTFLEEVVGVRWWTSVESTVPHTPSLHVDDLDVTYTPKLKYRESFNHDAVGDRALFASRLKLNGHMTHIPEELGGHYTLIGWCHTSFDLIPPRKYFGQHPDWFAQINGKRQTGTQLCLSNPEMRKELIRNALARVRRNPAAGIISISQNDGYGPCQCDACKAIVKEEGSEAGPWIRLCNEAAAEINKEFPDFLVETLAYVYSRHPPKVTKPSDHVLVRLCSIECDFAHPLEAPSNKSFADDLRGWSAIAPNLFVWNYVTNFSNYLIPHPNMAGLGPDLRFFVDHHVVGVFEQGDTFNVRAGDFLPLRLWLLAHLMWDPSRDQAKLREEYLAGYYGAAAPHLAQYLELVNAAPAKDPKLRVGCGNANTKFLSDAELARAATLFDNAAAAVAGDKELSYRVARERLALEHVQLLRYDFAAAAKSADPKAEQAKYRARVYAWGKAYRAAGAVNMSEMQGFESYVPALAARADRIAPVTLPKPGESLAPGQFDIQEDRFTLYRRGHSSELVDDPKASNGRAARMPGNIVDWAVQFHVSKDASFVGTGPWALRVVVRVDATSKQGSAFQLGLYNGSSHRSIFYDRPDLTVAGDGEYHVYTIAAEELNHDMYVWLAPADAGGVKNVYVDRIFIEKQPRTGEAQ